MISILDINKAINDTIKNALVGTSFALVPIVAEDTKEILRPSFKVSIDNATTGKFNSLSKERTLTVRVYFFAQDMNKYKIDNLKVQEILENAFLEDLQVNESFFMPLVDDIESEISDSVLITSFELYSIEEIEDTTEYEPTEELDFEIQELESDIL